MLLALHEFKENDKRKLMDIYAEGNWENVDYFYPGYKDKSNIPSLAWHRKCGFEIEHENAINYLTGKVNDNCYGMVYRG